MRDHRQKVFLNISCLMTGFSEIELEGTGLLDLYYNEVGKQCDSASLDLFFAEAETILLESNQEVDKANALIASNLMPDGNYDAVAKKIILLWYTGMWFPDLANIYNAKSYVTSDSYQQGLVWNVVGAHPPGARQPGYGSWADRPIENHSD